MSAEGIFLRWILMIALHRIITLDVINAQQYDILMIASFRCKETERIWNEEVSRAFPREIQRSVRRKLLMIDAATSITDLLVPPGNRLEALKGDRAGQYSIRVNDQWRICLQWRESNAHQVELVDYH
jgi:proteic killer suppression protein